MCGIVGFVGARADMDEILQAMMDRIVHRGPDGEGRFVDGQVALGHPELPKERSRSEERRVGKECRSRWSPYH